jgi:hypothetical protein
MAVKSLWCKARLTGLYNVRISRERQGAEFAGDDDEMHHSTQSDQLQLNAMIFTGLPKQRVVHDPKMFKSLGQR